MRWFFAPSLKPARTRNVSRPPQSLRIRALPPATELVAAAPSLAVWYNNGGKSSQSTSDPTIRIRRLAEFLAMRRRRPCNPGWVLTTQAIDVEAIAAEIRGLWRSGTQIDLLTSRIPDLGVNDAYQFASSLRKLREADGERRRLRLASPSKVLRRRLTSAAARRVVVARPATSVQSCRAGEQTPPRRR